MALPKLTPLELKIMEVLWARGALPVREIQEALPLKKRPAYTTVQTILYRLEKKQAVKRTKKISNAHIFAAVLSKDSAQRRIVDELLSLFGGSTRPLMSHLIETGKLTLEDVEAARETVRKFEENKEE